MLGIHRYLIHSFDAINDAASFEQETRSMGLSHGSLCVRSCGCRRGESRGRSQMMEGREGGGQPSDCSRPFTYLPQAIVRNIDGLSGELGPMGSDLLSQGYLD